MNKKIMFGLIIGMFFISVVSANSYLGTQYESMNIIETCVVNGFPCPSDFLCNITISNPDNNLIVLNSPMTKNDTIYNYTFSSTDVLGDYDINVYCSNVTLSGNAESNLVVTTTGREPNIMITIVLILCSLGLFMLALYLKNQAVGFIAGILFMIAGTHSMIYGFGDLADMYTRAIAVVIIGFGSFIVLVSGIEWLEDLS